MSVTKFTEEGQDKRKAQLEYLRKQMADIKDLNAGKDDPFWKKLKSVIERFSEVEENAKKLGVVACASGGYWDSNQREFKEVSNSKMVADLRVAVERQSAFKLVIDLVEKTDEQLDHLKGHIKAVEAQFKEAKEQLA